MYRDIEMDDDHMLCISRMWTILDGHSAYKYLIPTSGNFKDEQCTRTCEVQLVPDVGYHNMIIFDTDCLFMWDQFQACGGFKGILLEPSTAFHEQTDGQTEIVYTKVVTLVHACELQ